MEEYTTKEDWHTLPDTHKVYTKAWLVGISRRASEFTETFSLIRFFLVASPGPHRRPFCFSSTASRTTSTAITPFSRLSPLVVSKPMHSTSGDGAAPSAHLQNEASQGQLPECLTT